jgi:hypothetical protein
VGSALLFSLACAFLPNPLVASLAVFIGVFSLQVTYWLSGGLMTFRGDLLYLSTWVLLTSLVLVFVSAICGVLASYGASACSHTIPRDECLALLLPGQIVAGSLWLYFRLKQFWENRSLHDRA